MELPSFLRLEFETEADVGKAILDELGYGVANDNSIYEQDTFAPVQFQGKTIKYSPTPDTLYLSENDVLFDPVHNLRMITTLLGNYIDKEEASGKEVLSMHDDVNRDNRTTSHTIKFANQDPVTSKYYRNRCLAICDNILDMANANCDLTKFDDKEEKR